MSVRTVEVGEYTEDELRVQRAGEALHRDGASPAGALELLAAITEDRTWERVADVKGRSFKGRFRAFVEARAPFGLGYDPDQLPKVLALRHPHESVPDVAYRMATMRDQVRMLLLTEIAPAIPALHAGPGRGHKTERTTLGFTDGARSETAERTVRRLKRDDPDLAEKVVTGQVSAYAAAREKGWKPPRIQVTTPERIAAKLRLLLPREAITRLAELLASETPE